HRGHHYWHLLRHVLRGRHATHFALTQLGKPYVYGAASPRVGFDCSGLVMWAYAHVGVRLPHSTYAQIRLGRHVSRRHLPRGVLVFTTGGGHAGIDLGHGEMVNAPHTGARVSRSPLSQWSIVALRRVA